MSRSWSARWLPTLPRPGTVLLLTALAVGLNLLELELLGGARILLGGFVAVPCVLLLPTPWGLLVAALAFAPTVLVFGHPFAFILGVVEAIVLTVLVRRRRVNPILADALFWILLAPPLSWAMYCRVAQQPPELLGIMLAKQALTQMTATTVAYVATQLWPALGSRAGGTAPGLRALVFNYFYVLTLVPLVLVGVGFSVFSRQVVEQEEQARLHEAAAGASRQLEQFLTLHQAVLVSAATTIEQQPESAGVLLESIRRTHPAFITLLATDAEGRLVQTAPPGALPQLRGSSVADREYFRAARDRGEPFVSGVFRGRGFGRDLLVALSVPLRDAQGRFAGIVQGSLEIERFGRIALGDADGGVRMVLADAHGRVIHAHPAAGLQALADLRYTTLRPLLVPGGRGLLTHDLAGSDHVLQRVRSHARRCEPFGLWVIAQRPVLAPFGQLRRTYALIGVIFVGVIGAAGFVARAARRRLAGPLEHFGQAAEAQAQRGIVAEIAPPAEGLPREIALVFAAFNRLAGRLEATYSELRRSNAELDCRVAERTAQAENARRSAEAASRAKTEFLTMASHEIRTPLNAIIGLAEPPVVDSAPAEMHARFDRIRRAGEHLLRVVNDLLDLARVEAGKLELTMEPVELRAGQRELLALFAPLAERRGLSLVGEFTADVPEWVRTDGGRLQQVLINLLGNALKFTTVGGIRVRVERSGGTTVRPRLRFAVIDTGPGIPLEQQERLFKAFAQLPGPDGRPAAGSGLGLMISRGLVEMLGGTLQLRSDAGQGTEFHFTLELDRLEPPSAVAVSPTAPVEAGEPRWRVLAADDNVANQEVLRLMLEPRCARLMVVDTGAAALAELQREEFDVALIDLDMPDCDGLTVARRWRSEAPAGARCRLIAVSAHRRREHWSQCEAAGFAAYVEKPILRAALWAEIERLAGSPTASASADQSAR